MKGLWGGESKVPIRFLSQRICKKSKNLQSRGSLGAKLRAPVVLSLCRRKILTKKFCLFQHRFL